MITARTARRAGALTALLLGLSVGLVSAADNPQEFVVSFNKIDVEFDPHHSIYSAEAQIFTAIYEGLFSYDPESLDPVKAACRDYKKSSDGKTYTFYIRDDALWSDGTPLLAGDFRDAWLRAISPAQKADYASFFDIIKGAKNYRTGKNADAESVGVTVVSDRILMVKLESKADYFTRLLCHHSFSPIHPSMLRVRDWVGKNSLPVNGPYRIESSDGEKLSLVKNERYWDGAAVSLPRLALLFSDNDNDTTRRFNGGEIHWIEGSADFDGLIERSIQANPMFSTSYWFFSCGKAPWNNADLRRALALLLPWNDIRSDDYGYMPTSNLVLPFSGYRGVKGITEADKAEAARLLDKTGHKDGKGLPPIVILCPEGEGQMRVPDLMKKAWEALPKLKVEIRTVPDDRYYATVRGGSGDGDKAWTLAISTWIGDFADPLAFLQMWSADSNLNDAHLADKKYDGLLADAAAQEGSARLALLGKAETHLLAGAAVLPMYHSMSINVINTSYVKGWYPNALDIHPFKYLAFGERPIRADVASR